MDYIALKAEIQTDPAARGYAPFVTSGADNKIAALLNAGTLTRVDRVTREEWMLWTIATGAVGKATIAARGNGAIAEGSIGVLEISKLETVPIGAPRMQTILGQMVTQGWITAGQRAAIETTATVTSSRAFALFGQAVTDQDVAVSLRG